MKTVAVMEGWAGGPHLTKKLRQELTVSGFKVGRQSKSADIIIAHSAGCYFLPKDMRAEKIMLIDPPYWPGKPILKRWLQMSKNESNFLLQEFGRRRLIFGRLWEFYYILIKPLYTYSVLRSHKRLDFLEKLGDRQTILVHNKNDEFCSPQIKNSLKNYKNIQFVELPGHHSDYYTNPKPYVELIKSS